MAHLRKQSQTAHPLQFLLVSSTDHITGVTGVTPTVKLSKNGAAGASPAGAVSEIDATNAPGWYQVAGNATDAGTLGPLILHATATGADPCDVDFQVVAFDPDSATNLGLSALPTASPAANGGLPTVDASNNVHGLQTRTVSDASVIGTSTLTGTAQTGDAFAYLGTNVGATGANLRLAKGTQVTGLNDIAAGTQMDLVNAPNATALAAIGTAVWAATTRTLSAFGTLAADVWAVATRTITGGTIGTYTGNTPQTGDAYARLGAPAGASVSADVAAVKTDTGNQIQMTTGTGTSREFTATALTNAPAGGGGGGGTTVQNTTRIGQTISGRA